MNITFLGNGIRLMKTDRKYYTETALYYAAKKALQAIGLDVIKGCPAKDGHMFGDNYTFYIRDRKRRYCFFDNFYAVRDAAKDFNSIGHVDLTFFAFADNFALSDVIELVTDRGQNVLEHIGQFYNGKLYKNVTEAGAKVLRFEFVDNFSRYVFSDPKSGKEFTFNHGKDFYIL